MFDTTTANYKSAPHRRVDDIPARWTGEEGLCIWEEHCVECGQPECFKVCAKFVRGFDGKCARLRYGIMPHKGGAWVSFLEWGKLEGVYTGVIVGARPACFLQMCERIISTIARGLNRLMSFIPGRIGAITIWRRLRKWMFLPFAKGEKRMFALSGSVWASESIELTFTIFQDEKEIFLSRINLKKGWNTVQLSLPPIQKGARLLLFPVKETKADLYFAELLLKVSKSDSFVEAKPLAEAKGAAQFVKCLAWDLDNTLWEGVLVEDGAESLILRDEAVNLIKKLDARGILNTICSKNDFVPAWEQLKKFGLSEYFVFPEINWLPKSGNLKHIAKEININIDTFAFIDDSAFERGEVRAVLPMVRIYRENELAKIAEEPAFNPPVSMESAGRRLTYLKEMERKQVARSFEGDYEGFLKSCEIQLQLKPLLEEKITARCWELVQRSNQLNLTSRRYSREEFDAFLNSVEAWAIYCRDKFGDYGIVGFVALEKKGIEVCVKEFVVSCRVAKKKCEQSVLLALAEDMFQAETEVFTAELIETGRNIALIEAFGEMPFEVTFGQEKRCYKLNRSCFEKDNYFSHKTILNR